MNDDEIRRIVESGRLLLLENDDGEYFLYDDNCKILIPVNQKYIEKDYGCYTEIENQFIRLKTFIYQKELIGKKYAQVLFDKLVQIKQLEYFSSRRWFVNARYPSIRGYYIRNIVYNGTTRRIESLKNDQKAYILQVIYLPCKSLIEDNRVNRRELSQYGLKVSDRPLSYISSESQNDTKDNVNTKNEDCADPNIQKLLDCDKNRCGLAGYEQEMLYDIKAGHWDVYENKDAWEQDQRLVARDPRLDIKKNGVIGIDFGTKSTVVVRQEGSNEIRPIRIGSLSLKAEVAERDFENPTIISCSNITKFLEDYSEKDGRPETSCDDLFVSYDAYENYKNCPTENFYAYFSELKKWANMEKEDAVVLDIRERAEYHLGEECSSRQQILNPIEVYAYYIGLYINNMRNGIYLKYMMSFPVKYSKAAKELIRSSFEKGLKKSLPATVVEDAEIMSKFTVEYQISEPAAYAVTALEQSGFKPADENEKYLYGIFDFGGGTTDFDFGVWRGADDDEFDKFNCDYVLECFGADSDVRLGGENILEMLAYQVFKDNKSMAAEKKIACALPLDQTAFIGGEQLISNSQSANRNLTLLKEKLRPLWEQHEDWEKEYCKGNSENLSADEKKEEFIEIQMYDFNGKTVPNCRFLIDTGKLLKLIKERIQKGVDAFFQCIEKSILGNKAAQSASEKIYIFLAGNSCKSIFVKEIFQSTIQKYNQEYSSIEHKDQDRFELIEPLEGVINDDQYLPNAKTSVAYGLVKSRPGGKIYVKKNYETDSNEETRFKYYLGIDRRNYFHCRLAPMMEDESGQNMSAYHIWHKFQGAGMGTARIYYTENPCADSKAEKLAIGKIPFHEIMFEADENKYLFVRAVKPSVIEYTIAGFIEEIDEESLIKELDLDKQ